MPAAQVVGAGDAAANSAFSDRGKARDRGSPPCPSARHARPAAASRRRVSRARQVSRILQAAEAGDVFAFESAAADLDGCDNVAAVAAAARAHALTYTRRPATTDSQRRRRRLRR